jgi:hypothetical protein
MRITKVRLTRRHVVIDWQTPEGTFGLRLRDNPLPEFSAAVANLKTVVLSILHLPTEYSEGMKTTGLTMVEKQEAELVCIVAQKELPECHSPFNIATPLRFLSHPEEEGSYSPALDDKHVASVQEVIS